MNTFDQENDKLFNIVNQNAYQQKAINYARSQDNDRKKIRKEKQQARDKKRKQAIATILTIATLTSAVIATHSITTNIIENNNAVISIQEANDIIDEKITTYQKLMSTNSDAQNQIEVIAGRNFNSPSYEETVYYKPENLAKHIVEAAKISESEVRCVIIAAYKIINAPYTNETIDEALRAASTLQEEEIEYQVPSSSKEFLEQQGYENWEEYKMQERTNIKKLYAAEIYVKGENRKVM